MADASWGFWRDRRTGKLWGVVTASNGALLPYLRYGRRGVDWIERNRTEFVQVATPLYAYAS